MTLAHCYFTTCTSSNPTLEGHSMSKSGNRCNAAKNCSDNGLSLSEDRWILACRASTQLTGWPQSDMLNSNLSFQKVFLIKVALCDFYNFDTSLLLKHNVQKPKQLCTRACVSLVFDDSHTLVIMTAPAQMDYWRASKQLTGCQGYSERIRPIYTISSFFKCVNNATVSGAILNDDHLIILSVWLNMRSLNVFL